MTDGTTSRFALSICIPTYNRAAELPFLLDSIAAQIGALEAPWSRDSVEVVISDNASTDHIAQVVEHYRSILPSIVFIQHPQNLGADRNYLAVAEAAGGVFCWMMGSDDKIEEGALLRVLDATLQWPEAAGFSVNMVPYDGALQQRIPQHLPPFRWTDDRLVRGAETIFREFGIYYGYLSGQVIRRDLWNSVCATGEQLQYLNAYVHVLVIGRMLQKAPSWGFVHHACVGWRSGNDSFLGDGWVRRLEIDLIGYRSVTVALFGEHSPVVADIRDQLAARHNYHQFRHAKLRGESRASLARASRLLTASLWRSPVYWTKLLPWILAPGWLTHAIYEVYKTRLRPTVRRVKLQRERARIGR
ncbi:glycosyltransferase family 2 protein [Sphingomonas qomolangmaensis]|uniref:Glycosyltransferase n=1 Tax=Sphingomonas qomolangmaensis TaxID=2918765 RepID=A0ABY5L8U7_9SPHN|nr:glycosyltransferase family 2 protein [Sphingomonas qomolangmaensis]UUL82170.1 glycosyltransferase [Sphingomonas qomolangmaensis]